MEYLKSEQIEDALSKEYRQYLAGHLERPQVHLQNIEDDIEIGISKYQKFTADVPHKHPVATEHGYVLEGATKVLLLESREEMEYRAGDFFIIRPDVPYATKNAPNTKILFIKSPGINDKTLMPYDEDVKAWLQSW